MTEHSGYVQRLLREWASPAGIWPSVEEARRYSEAMAIPFVAHSAAEYYRWLVRSQLRPDGWRFAAQMRQPISVPVLHLHGTDDGAVVADTARGSAHYVTGPFAEQFVQGAGHFLPEEAPERVNDSLLDWLGDLGRR
jgi:pimeloyl-ACP methyl ester carboxylesterase